MMEYLETPLFGLVLSLAFFELGKLINRKTKSPIANPLLIAAIGIIAILIGFKIPLSTFNLGGSIIEFFLPPATIVLVVPLYRQLATLKKYWLPIFVGGFVGSIVAMSSVYLIGKLLNIDSKLILSFLPKSITTPFGIEVSKMVGGIPSITVFSIVITGIFGNILAVNIYKLLGDLHPVAKGVGIGVSSHAVGTSRAIEMGEVEGAMSALSIVVAGIITVLVVQIILPLLAK